MNKPVLVVMAAGMGSRYGGMKQIDPSSIIPSMTPTAQALTR